MGEPVTISSLELENVKRITAVELTPTSSGLTVIGGNNGQGKTSVLDAIAWALGGDRYKPSNATRDGSVIPPRIKVTLSNGLIVERSGKNSVLKVTDPFGKRSGQQLLNEFIDELAINLPKFMAQSATEKAKTLLQVLGIDQELAQLNHKENRLYNQRLLVGQQADQKKKYAEELPFFPDAPDSPMSITDLIQKQQDILARNGENHRKRLLAQEIQRSVGIQEERVADLERKLREAKEKLAGLKLDLADASKDAESLHDESTAQIEADIANFEAINEKVRSNCERVKADQDAQALRDQYDQLTLDLKMVRDNKKALLEGARLPLPGLSVEDGELTYNGKKWDCMSGSEQLRVSTAIAKAVNPKCGFVLLDKLEQMDVSTLSEFNSWLTENDMQAIATRVSTGSECSIIIENGYARDGDSRNGGEVQRPLGKPAWKAGVF